MPGKIVILNGTSSAGKTTLAAALRDVLEEPYLHLGIDVFADALPPGFRGTVPPADQGILFVSPVDAAASGLEIVIGPFFDDVVAGMHRSWAALARCGVNLIADHWLWRQSWLEDSVAALDGLPVLLVGLRCPLEVAEQRERERQDRPLGAARAVFTAIHDPGIYDLEIDTSVIAPRDGALSIKRLLAEGSFPDALVRLRSRFSEHRVRAEVDRTPNGN